MVEQQKEKQKRIYIEILLIKENKFHSNQNKKTKKNKKKPPNSIHK